MRVAFVSQPMDAVLPPNQNSISLWTYEVARRLAKSCEVIVYLRKWREKETEDSIDGVNYRYASVTFDGILISLLQSISRLFHQKRPLYSSILYYIGYALQISLDLRKRQCTIAHLYNFSQFVPIIRFFNPSIKIVLNMHCEWLSQLDRSFIEKRLRDVDLILGCSDYITNKIRHAFPKASIKCRTAYNGLNVEQFYSKQNCASNRRTIKVLFVGRVSPEKGLHTLLEAFRMLSTELPEVSLQVVGSISQLPMDFIVDVSDDDLIHRLKDFYVINQRNGYYQILQNMIRSYGLTGRVSFTGFQPYARVLDYYRDADVLVNPSYSESFGRSLIEAMACGVPVVATCIGGMTEIVEDGKNGLLVDRGDAVGLGHALLRILKEEKLRNDLVQQGYQTVFERYAWQKVVDDVTNYYERLRAVEGADVGQATDK